VFGGSAGGDYGGPYAVPAGSAHNNCISGNDEYGLKIQDTATGGPLLAERNWWGNASGPQVAKGTGDKVIGPVDYDPWIGATGGENIVVDPELLELGWSPSSGTVSVDYLGGGSLPVYLAHVVFTWDSSKAHLDDVNEGDLFAGLNSRFFVTGTGNTRTVDWTLLGAQPGVAGPGTLFTLDFSSVAGQCGTYPITITQVVFRDNANHTLAGIYARGGAIYVDRVAPTAAVTIDNTTNTITDEYAKNGDNLTLTALVGDACGPVDEVDATANLSTLLAGGGTAVPPNTYVGGLATWLLSGVTLVPDDPEYDPAVVTVTVTDRLGNVGTGSDGVIVDNTPPDPIQAFTVSPGNEELVMAWANPTGLDENYCGVTGRYFAWGDYPEYDPPAPSYPANVTQGVLAFDEQGLVMAWNLDIEPRDTYYASAWVYDYALNYSPVGGKGVGQGRATNYWLGDVADGWASWGHDGLVNADDIERLSTTHYGSAPIGFNESECDVGPTDDHSRLGIPMPDKSLDFEDLIIFAMNYGVVAPKIVPFLAEPADGALALSLVALMASPEGEVQVALRLDGNASEVKGLSAVVSFDPSQVEFVSARLSEEMSSPLADVFFWSGSAEGKAQVDLAVLGTDVTIGGSGDVAVLTFRVLAGEYALGFESVLVRGAENEELVADLEGYESRPEVPTAFRLSQNIPNPFNPRTVVAYEVPQSSEVAIRVYDVAGKLVRTLVDGSVEPGRYAVTWDGTSDGGESVGSGVYFCVMDAPSYHATHKMMLLK
jgi:hypothetical protein